MPDDETSDLPDIRLLILDVDGVLTDGGLPYDAEGQRLKTFHVQDGGAIRLWQEFGGRAAILSGRSSPAVEARARDLGIDCVVQGALEKLAAYDGILRRLSCTDAETSMIGDDFVDLPPLRRCGYPMAVANARPQVKRAARYITRRAGGYGAVAEAIEHLFRRSGAWQRAIARWAGRPAARENA